MKKHFVFLVYLFSIIFLLKPLPIFATEGHNEILMPDAQLFNSEDRSAIEELTPDIIEFANLFQDENIEASESDIDFSKTYCVYTDVDVFDKLPITRQKVEELTTAAKKVWAVPVYSNGKTVIVQVSKGLKLNERSQMNLTPDEIEEIKTKEGKWQVVASTCYDHIIDIEKKLQEIYDSNNISDKKLECIFFGGVPGIQSIIGVLLEEDVAIGVTSLQKDFVVENNSQTKGKEKNITISKDKVYTVEEFAENTKILRTIDNNVQDSTSGLFISKEQKWTNTGYFIGGGFIILVVFILAWKRLKHKRL